MCIREIYIHYNLIVQVVLDCFGLCSAHFLVTCIINRLNDAEVVLLRSSGNRYRRKFIQIAAVQVSRDLFLNIGLRLLLVPVPLRLVPVPLRLVPVPLRLL